MVTQACPGSLTLVISFVLLLHDFVKVSHDLAEDRALDVSEGSRRLEVVAAILAPNNGNVVLLLFDARRGLPLLVPSVKHLSMSSKICSPGREV